MYKEIIKKNTYTISYKTIICWIMLFYMLLFEWGVFEIFPNVIIYPFKMLLPLSLLLFSVRKKIKNNIYYNNFLLAYFLFLLWSLLPSLYGGLPEESVEQWLKFLSRFCFIVLAGNYLLENKDSQIWLMKAFVLLCLFSFGQYLAVWFFKSTGLFSFSSFSIARGEYYGPLGLLGEIGSTMRFGIGKIYRLHGFWFEPSMASGFMFASYFLAKNIFFIEKKIFWKRASYICLMGGFLCFSNAGYLAIAMAVTFGIFLNMINGKSRIATSFLKLSLPILLIFIAIFGRSFVASNMMDVDIARAVVGVRGGSCAGTTCGGVDYSADPSDGRLGIYQKNLNIANNYPLGIGIRLPGKATDKETGFRTPGGNAIIGWLVYTGYIGLFLLIVREVQVFLFSLRNKGNISSIYLSQAWVALFFQNMLYGTLMTPFYLLIVILLFSSKKNQASILR